MERAVLDIVVFSDADVIATSTILPSIGTDTNQSGIPIIWLTQSGVANYNAIAAQRGDIPLEDNYHGYYGFSYYSYNGDRAPDLYWVTTGANNTPNVYNDLTAGDTVTYALILNWLEQNGNIKL